jgi:glycosyltransferase involved in cell wall biosynthesis
MVGLNIEAPEASLTSVCRPLVSIVAPVYNEEGVLIELLHRIVNTVAPLENSYDFEFIFVDDGSRDRTLELAKSLLPSEPRLRVIELRRNYGQTAALQAALDQAQGDIIISMDADLQHFPEEIPQFLEKIEEGYDVVCGWRYDRKEGIIRRWPSRMANWLIRKVSGLTIHDIGTTYRAYRAEVIRDVRLLGENHRFVPVFAKIAGAKICELKIQNIQRPMGKSNYGISRTLNVFIDIFFLYFFTHYFDRPIRLFGKISLFLTFCGGLIAIVLLGVSFLTGMATVREHSGWFFLCLFLFVTAIQMLLTGILSEVMARLYFSSETHTTYKIRREWPTKEQ